MELLHSDSQIQKAVLEELSWDPIVDAPEVGVEVDVGVVTLTGRVETYGKKFAAEAAALRVDGVRAVANDIELKVLYGMPTDTEIATSIANAFESNSFLRDLKFDISVKGGYVTLAGEAEWEYQRSTAARIVRETTGVRDLVNLLTIKARPVSVENVREKIEQALVRDAEVDAERISVRAIDGTVTLTGNVRSWSERTAAASAAWRAGGVTSVHNQIQVSPR
jgi:osmotically-inducible protein OsmY